MNDSVSFPRASILYVDDDLENLSSFKAIFRRDYHVHLASSAAEGLEILRNTNIQVLITDQRMPEMNGTDLLEIAANEFPETRRFLLTAFSDFPPLVEAINQGRLQGYFSKPIDGDFIKSRIEEGLRNYYLEHENRELLESIRQNEIFLTAIIENIPDIVFVKDAKDLKYLRINRAGEKILGLNRKDVEGKKAHDCFPSLLADLFAAQDDDVLRSKTILDIPEDPIVSKNSGHRIFHTKKIPIMNDEGVPQYILGVSRDITDQLELEKKEKTLEEKLRNIQKMKSIGTLAGGIAHDFNNILSSIIGYTELSMMAVDLNRPSLPHLKEILTAGQRAKDLVKQILAFARQSEDKILPVQVDIIVKEVLKLIRSTIPSTIDIRSDIQSGLSVLGSPTQIHQVFMNLCTNAAQAMEEKGGTLKIQVTKTDADDPALAGERMDAPGGLVKIRISDTGCGISPDIKELIFEPYFTTKGPSEGTGMGLATVYGIVKSMDGLITCESKPGRGSAFTVFFPATDDRIETTRPETEALVRGHERILVVDDEESIIKVLSESLEFLGYKPTAFSDSVDALACFSSSPESFDLVITDMTMPRMTGDVLATKIMEIRPEIPVVLCTGYSRKISEDIAGALGIRAFLYKPLTIRDLSATLRTILDKT